MALRIVWLLAFVLVLACKKSEPQEVVLPAKTSDRKVLSTLPTKDLVGYLSGNYHTGGNNPAIYADLDRKMFVMMGKRSFAELPMTTKPAEAAAAFESFFVLHGYHANGKTPTDDHQKVMVDGKEMVVVSTDELFPKMPADLKALFTPEQAELLYHTPPSDGYKLVAAKYPLMYCYTHSIAVLSSHDEHEFPIEKASDAFAAFAKLLPK
jgi:hypothetical protein